MSAWIVLAILVLMSALGTKKSPSRTFLFCLVVWLLVMALRGATQSHWIFYW